MSVALTLAVVLLTEVELIVRVNMRVEGTGLLPLVRAMDEGAGAVSITCAQCEWKNCSSVS